MRPIHSVVALLAIAALSSATMGCSSNQESDADDDSALTAEQSNKALWGLKEHVVTAAPAGSEAAAALGIKTWDVYAGTVEDKLFTGAVFFASDANGDVVYEFVSNIDLKYVRLTWRTKSGGVELKEIQKRDAEILVNEVKRVRTSLDSLAKIPTDYPAEKSHCLRSLAEKGLDLVGTPFLVGLINGAQLTRKAVKSLAADDPARTWKELSHEDDYSYVTVEDLESVGGSRVQCGKK